MSTMMSFATVTHVLINY